MQVDIATGLLPGVRQVLSPFFDERAAPGDISLIVVHGISMPPAEYGGPWIERLFTGNLPRDHHPYFEETWQLRVSAHLLVRRDGEGGAVRAVPSARMARGGARSTRDVPPATTSPSASSSKVPTTTHTKARSTSGWRPLIRTLCAAYPGLSPQRVVGHSDIAPGRKQDPGAAFDWPRLRQLIESP